MNHRPRAIPHRHSTWVHAYDLHAYGIPVPLHPISVCIVRTVRYLSSQGDSEAVRYQSGVAGLPRLRYCEFRGSGRSCSRSAAGISACSRPARQCPDRPVTPRSNPGMHAVSENSEFRIPKCPDCIRAKSVRELGSPEKRELHLTRRGVTGVRYNLDYTAPPELRRT